MDESWKATLFKRILPGVLCLGGGFAGLTLAEHGQGQMGVFGRVLICVPFLILGAIFLAKPIAHLVAVPFVGMLFPDDHSYLPPPIYRLPEMYVNQGRLLDAVEEYRKIIHNHPRETRAYLALLEVYFLHMNNLPEAEKTYRAGLRRLRNPEDRMKLTETYQALQAGIPLTVSSIASSP